MEALFHFITQIVKIVILSALYATLVLVVFLLVGKLNPSSYFSRKLSNKKKKWWVSGLFISIGLTIFSFTYWGDHGLGDSARIPIGHFKEVSEINGTQSYIEPGDYKYGVLMLHSFSKSNSHLVGKTEISPVDNPKTFFSWDLAADEVVFFDSEKEYNSFASEYKLPEISEFKSFGENYQDYWGGLKFWLLP